MKLTLRIVAGIISSPVVIPVFILIVLPIYAITGDWIWGE